MHVSQNDVIAFVDICISFNQVHGPFTKKCYPILNNSKYKMIHWSVIKISKISIGNISTLIL